MNVILNADELLLVLLEHEGAMVLMHDNGLVSFYDPKEYREVRNVLGHLVGFESIREPKVYFSKFEMMKLSLVK